MALEILFWVCLVCVIYGYLGYGVLLKILNSIFRKNEPNLVESYPTVSLVVCCFNEGAILQQKINNVLALDYPKDKLEVLFVTDGSTDNSLAILEGNTSSWLKYTHSDDRRGKVGAINRVLPKLKSEITIFNDANTVLNTDAIKLLVSRFNNPKVGAVSGEKRVLKNRGDSNANTEGLYWKYESFLKKQSAQLYTLSGAAGELLAVRTRLLQEVKEDTLLDDLEISMQVLGEKMVIDYESKAIASEIGSHDLKEEWGRKVRICKGAFQFMKRNFFRSFRLHPVAYWQFFSHRILRWVLCPLALVFLLTSSFSLQEIGVVYEVMWYAQVLFYAMAILAYLLEQYQIQIRILKVPFYFCFMNVAVFSGLFSYLFRPTNAAWKKAKRSDLTLID